MLAAKSRVSRLHLGKLITDSLGDVGFNMGRRSGPTCPEFSEYISTFDRFSDIHGTHLDLARGTCKKNIFVKSNSFDREQHIPDE